MTGAGALLLTPEAAARLVPMHLGGGQERGRRGGTSALPNIAAFAAAALAATPEDAARLVPLRDAIEAAAVAAGASIIGIGAPRLPNTRVSPWPGLRSESQVIALDLAGFAVSAGAACSSGKVGRSHVLEAMGADDPDLRALAGAAVRGVATLEHRVGDVAAFAGAYLAMARRMERRAA